MISLLLVDRGSKSKPWVDGDDGDVKVQVENVYPVTYATTIAKHRPKVQSQQEQLLDEFEGRNSNG